MTTISLSPVAQRYFDAITSDRARARVTELAATVTEMSDEDLKSRVGSDVLSCAIYPSMDIDCALTIMFDEATRRCEAAGRHPHCPVHNLYTLGWNSAYRSQGHTPPKGDCRCDEQTDV